MSIILLAHGSRHPDAAAGVEALAAAVAALVGEQVQVAYLDLQPPHVAEVARPGDVVVPLLFTDAFHQRVDVPQAVAGLGVTVTPGLMGPSVLDVLASRVQRPSVLFAVSSSSGSPEVFALARALTERCVFPVEVAFATQAPSVADVFPRLPPGGCDIIPLFVTAGLLLDRLASSLPKLASTSGRELHLHPPLTTALAPVIAAHFPLT